MAGTGVAAATYPYYQQPSSAEIVYVGDDRYSARIAATDLGTGARTVLTQIAADALGVPLAAVTVGIGRTDLPMGTTAGGSGGTSSWGSAIVGAAAAIANAAHHATGVRVRDLRSRRIGFSWPNVCRPAPPDDCHRRAHRDTTGGVACGRMGRCDPSGPWPYAWRP